MLHGVSKPRENISEERMMELKPAIKESGLQTKTEVILGLPGDSYASHLYTLKTLLKADIDEILVFSCMLLPGSEMFEEREKLMGFYGERFTIADIRESKT